MRRKGIKCFAFALTLISASAILWQCNKPKVVAAAENNEQTDTTGDVLEYESEDGWKVSYNVNSFTVNDTLGDGAICFNYTGESGGIDAVIISYVPDKMPDEVLYEKVADIDENLVQRSEGWFGSSSYWAHTRFITPESEDPEAGDAVIAQYTAIEHNGGSALLEVTTHVEADEGKQLAIMDTIAGLIDTFELLDHEPQTEYAYIPGNYVRAYVEEIEGDSVDRKDTVVLNEDHTCEVVFQDTVDGAWTGEKLILNDGSEMSFSVEGDALYLEMASAGEWIEFSRE